MGAWQPTKINSPLVKTFQHEEGSPILPQMAKSRGDFLQDLSHNGLSTILQDIPVGLVWLFPPFFNHLKTLKSVEEPEAQFPEVTGECADMGRGVRLGGEGFQRTLWPQLLPVVGVWWLAEGKKKYIPWLPSQTGITNWACSRGQNECVAGALSPYLPQRQYKHLFW